MNKIETGKIENDHTARMLSDDELDMVSGALTLNYTKVEGVVARGYLSVELEDIIVSH